MATTLLFDVDGVLTDEHAQLDHPLVRKIASISQTTTVAFITGRSRIWLELHLIPSLLLSLGEIQVPTIRLAAEMGALRSGESTDYSWQLASEHAVPPEWVGSWISNGACRT